MMSAREGAIASESAIDSFLLVGTVLQDRVRVDRVVAEGGFGVVYEGEHLSLGVRVAIKVLKRESDDGTSSEAYAAQFLREARTIARIRHPNIVQVLDVATTTHRGEPLEYMVLEWCDGVSLDRWLDRRAERAMTAKEAWAIIGPIARAIAEAHDHGVAHRDLKPANVMIVEGKKGVVPMLLDFGIAKVMNGDVEPGSGVTATESVVRAFSPQYAAPEQVAGTRTGPWTDVHALALVMVELVLGDPAYKSDSRQWLLQEILSSTRPTAARSGVALGALDPVLDRALAFTPEDRYRNAHEFIAAVEEAFEKGVPTSTGRGAPRVERSDPPPTIDVAGSSQHVTGRRASTEEVRLTEPAKPQSPPAPREQTSNAIEAQPPVAARTRSSSTPVAIGAAVLFAVVGVVGITGRSSWSSSDSRGSQPSEPSQPAAQPRSSPPTTHAEPAANVPPAVLTERRSADPAPRASEDASVSVGIAGDSGVRSSRTTPARSRERPVRGGYRLE